METENVTSVVESDVRISSETQESDRSCQQTETKNKNLEESDGVSTVSVSANNDSESANYNSESEHGAVGGAEETFETVCKPCSEDDKNIEAFQYCIDCNEYLCEPCVVMHRGVRLTRRHKLVPKESVDTNSGDIINRREQCSLHGNEYIDWFCVEHDVLCCIVCKAIAHGNCNIRSLKEACIEYTLDETIQKLEETKSLLCNTIFSRQTLQENLKNDKDLSLQTLQKIDEDSEDVFKHIKSLVQKDREKTERTYSMVQKEIYNDNERHNQIKYSLESALDILKSSMSREYLFVQGKKAEVNLRQISDNLSESQKKHFRRIELEPEQELNVHFRALKAMNLLGHTDKEKKIYQIRHKNLTVNTAKASKQTIDITSMCFTDNMKIIAADWENSCLYLFDTYSFNVQKSSTLQLIHPPFDVCKVENKFAVTLSHGHVINFVSLRGYEIELDRNKIDTVEMCRGICYNDNKNMLFVCCGGYRLNKEGPGHIRVYDTEGKLTEIITENINCPWKIRFHKVTNALLVCDKNSLLKIETTTSNQFVCRLLRQICGKEFCFDDLGRIILVQEDLQGDVTSVSLLTKTGELIETLASNELLLEMDGIVSSIIFKEAFRSMHNIYIAFNNSTDIRQLELTLLNWKYGPSVQ